MNKKTYLLIGLIAIVIIGWFLMRKKKSPESSFRRRTGSGGPTNRAIYKCSRTVYNCDWGCAGGSITCPPGCVSTSTQTFENSGPCPYGTTNLGLIRFEL